MGGLRFRVGLGFRAWGGGFGFRVQGQRVWGLWVYGFVGLWLRRVEVLTTELHGAEDPKCIWGFLGSGYPVGV